MENLLIESTVNHPEVNFNFSTGLLQLLGRSIPENPVTFYKPLEDWLSIFLATTPQNVILSIYLDYLNTHSTECVLFLMKKIEEYKESSNNNVSIIWCFDEDDEDMETLGEDLSSLVNIPFEIKEVPEA